MKKHRTASMIEKTMQLAACLLLCAGLWGCGAQNDNAAADDSQPAALTEETSAQSDTADEYDYVHGEEGYFSLVDAGCGTQVKMQTGGTCWVTAASTSMESAFLLQHGQKIEIDPLEILEHVYGDDNTEGYILKPGSYKLDLGGWAWQITETLANGFGNYTLVEAEDYSSADIETLQELIRAKGGLNVAVNDARSSLFGTFGAYETLNDPDSEDFDHEVVLVGWDDHFPKEYFKQEASRDGAWLAQNTHGDSWGSDGFYWISYDTSFTEQTIFELSDEYSEVLSYDAGNENQITVVDTTKGDATTGNGATEQTTTVANVFHKKGTLKAIGTYATIPNQKIRITVYDSDFTTVLHEQTAKFVYQGYHTIPLERELDVEEYAVAVTYSGSAPVEGDCWEDSWLQYAADINPGESYVFLNDTWLDLSEQTTQEQLQVDFMPHNCCIKALY